VVVITLYDGDKSSKTSRDAGSIGLTMLFQSLDLRDIFASEFRNMAEKAYVQPCKHAWLC
jgi:hypothetical protein